MRGERTTFDGAADDHMDEDAPLELESSDAVADEGPSPTEDFEPPPDINAIWEEHNREQTCLERCFTLSELMLVTAFAAVSLSLVRWFNASVAAAVLGLVGLIGLVGLLTLSSLDAQGHRARLFRLCWWTLLLLYGIVAVVAVVEG